MRMGCSGNATVGHVRSCCDDFPTLGEHVRNFFAAFTNPASISGIADTLNDICKTTKKGPDTLNEICRTAKKGPDEVKTFIKPKKLAVQPLYLMESTRLDKVNRLLEKELAEILRQETAKTQGLLVSVSAVRTAPDLSFAKVFVSVFPSDKGEAIVKNLNEHVGGIRGALGNKVRYQLRVIPELRFDIDDSLDYLERIDELLKK